MFMTQPSRTNACPPPSHYAVAAGVPYLKQIGDAAQDGPSYPSQVPADGAPLVESAESQSSHSSTMGKLMRRVSSKRFTIYLTRSESRTEKEKDGLDNRKSQLVDIPLLETQLLPSLRDTVDRMTHPPRPRPDLGQPMDTQATPSSQYATSPLLPPTTGIPRFSPAPSPRPKSVLKSPARRNAAAPSTSNFPTPSTPMRNRADHSDSSRGLPSGSETSVGVSACHRLAYLIIP